MGDGSQGPRTVLEALGLRSNGLKRSIAHVNEDDDDDGDSESSAGSDDGAADEEPPALLASQVAALTVNALQNAIVPRAGAAESPLHDGLARTGHHLADVPRRA